jgi:hypothetical protein
MNPDSLSKYTILQAAAYYYHGLILDEGNSEKFHRTAVAALLSAEEFLRESRAACEAFHAASPISRQSTYIHISITLSK